MKPFDLQKALAGDPVQTKFDTKVIRLIHIPEAINPFQRILAVLDFPFDNNIRFFSEAGVSRDSALGFSSDLEMGPKKETIWINVYRDGSTNTSKSKEEADSLAYNRVGESHPIDYEV